MWGLNFNEKNRQWRVFDSEEICRVLWEKSRDIGIVQIFSILKIRKAFSGWGDDDVSISY